MARTRRSSLFSLFVSLTAIVTVAGAGCGDDAGASDASVIDAVSSWDAPNTDATPIDALASWDAPNAPDAVVPDLDAGPDAVPPDSRPADAMQSDAAGPPAAGVDILFVVDNSGSMAEEQAALAAAFSGFVAQIEASYGSRPSLQIGVISTDVGAGPFNISGCTGNGDNGELQSTATSACTPPSGAFIKDLDLGSGNRDTNYTGTMGDTFSCISQLGTNGCGFEQPLESMRRALNGSNAGNNGFLRPGAALAVIIVSDEDDCSTFDTNMFDTSQTSPTSPLGPLSSFRCFEFGVECNPDMPRATGAKTNCTPRNSSPYMYKIHEYVLFLQSLKPANWLVVASIAGPTSSVTVGVDQNTNPVLEPSCVSGVGSAAPAIRLSSFVGSFANTHQGTICGGLGGALGAIAGDIATALP